MTSGAADAAGCKAGAAGSTPATEGTTSADANGTTATDANGTTDTDTNGTAKVTVPPAATVPTVPLADAVRTADAAPTADAVPTVPPAVIVPTAGTVPPAATTPSPGTAAGPAPVRPAAPGTAKATVPTADAVRTADAVPGHATAPSPTTVPLAASQPSTASDPRAAATGARAPARSPDLDDPWDVRVATGVAGLLHDFNLAGVLSAADVHVAVRLGQLSAEPDERVLLALALAVRGIRAGSVCIDLAQVHQAAPDLDWPDPAEWVPAVLASPLVGDGRPLRWDLGLLYLDRYWRQEDQVHHDLLAREAQPPPPVDPNRFSAAVDRLLGVDAGQRAAADMVAFRWTTVLVGGPGTGKTTTVARVLAVLLDQPGPVPRLALAAPTGKAAARLQEAVQQEAATFGREDRDRLGTRSASTLHRLLRTVPGTNSRFRYNRTNRLPYDVVVVDETSMISLTLMARLLEALRPDTRLILVGDPNQLASVEAGAVLADLVAGLRGRLVPSEGTSVDAHPDAAAPPPATTHPHPNAAAAPPPAATRRTNAAAAHRPPLRPHPNAAAAPPPGHHHLPDPQRRRRVNSRTAGPALRSRSMFGGSAGPMQSWRGCSRMAKPIRPLPCLPAPLPTSRPRTPACARTWSAPRPPSVRPPWPGMPRPHCGSSSSTDCSAPIGPAHRRAGLEQADRTLAGRVR